MQEETHLVFGGTDIENVQSTDANDQRVHYNKLKDSNTWTRKSIFTEENSN